MKKVVIFSILVACVLIVCGLKSTAQTPVATDQPIREALISAIDDERQAQAYYAAVLAKFGQVRPYTQLVKAEARHEEILVRYCEQNGIEVPANQWATPTVPLPATLEEVRQQSLTREVKNVEMYDEFLKTIKTPALVTIFENLRSASLDHHIPALKGERMGKGHGAGRSAQTCPLSGDQNCCAARKCK